MATVGPLYPGSAPVNDPTASPAGVTPWTGPSNAQAEGGTGATVTATRDEPSQYLCLTNFGPALPAGTVDGIILAVRAKKTSGTGPGWIIGARLMNLVFSKGNWNLTLYTSSPRLSSALTGTYTYVNLGGATDTWDNPGPIPTSVANASTTGFTIQTAYQELSGSAGFDVDTARATYYYTPTATGGVNLLLMGCGSILSAASAWLGCLPWLRSQLWHAGYWLKGGRWTTRRLQLQGEP